MSANTRKTVWNGYQKRTKNRRVVQREKRISGDSHENVKTKKEKPAKVPPLNAALCKCRHGCKDIAASGQKCKLYDLYYAKEMTLPRQMTYLLSLMEVIPIRRGRHSNYDDPSKSCRQHTLVFMLPDTTGSFVRVCQKMFMETFRISSQTVEMLAKLCKKGELTYIEQYRGTKTVKYTEDQQQGYAE